MSFSRFALKIGVFTCALSLVLLGTTFPAHSQCYYGNCGITIDPLNPTDEECIQITVSGEMPDPCREVVYSYYLYGNTFIFYVDIYPIPVVCIQVIAEWSISEEFDPLPAGDYNVEAYVMVAGPVT